MLVRVLEHIAVRSIFTRHLLWINGISPENADVGSRTHTEELAIKAGLYISVSKAFVYRCYKEWRYGQEERAMEAQVKKSIVVDSRG